MKKKVQSAPKPLNVAAKVLADPRFRKRVVRDRTKYSRKGRAPSTRQFEGSIELATRSRRLIEHGGVS